MNRMLLSSRHLAGMAFLLGGVASIGFTLAANARDDSPTKTKSGGNPFSKLFSPLKEGEKKSEPFPGIEHIERTTNSPRTLTQHLVFLETKTPKLRILSTRPDRDGNHPPGTTKMETTRAFAERTKSHIAINANFFDNGAEAKKKGYTQLIGLAMSEGHFVSPWSAKNALFCDAIHFSSKGEIRFLERPKEIGDGFSTIPATDLYTAVTGHARLLREGIVGDKIRKTDPNKDLNPRTAIGQHRDGRLVIFLVDGRRPGHSLGMATHEVAEFLRERGVVDAIQLDGGGSSTLVFGDGTGKARVINKPSDLSERKVGNNLGFVLPGE